MPLTSRRTDGWVNPWAAVPTGNRLSNAYGEVGTLFAIVNRLATATAKWDWTLYEKAKSGIKEDRTPITKHPMIDFWETPVKGIYNRRRFMESVQQHVDLVGEGGPILTTVKLGKNFVPVEAWPTPPWRVRAVPDPYRFVKGWVYTSPDGEEIPLETHEYKKLMMPNPNDPYRGLGPVQSILTDIDSVKYSAEWNRNFFLNSAEPGGVIEVPEEMDDGQYDRLRDQWEASHKGVGKAHRVAILEAGAKWSGTSISQKDMQFVELRGIGRDVILEAFGFPKSVLGIVEDVNRANAEASEYLFSKWLIEDRLDRWRDWLNFDILPMYGNTGKGLEWDYESPVPENSEQRNAAVVANANALVAMTSAGYDATQTLEYLGMPAISFTKPEPKPIAVPGQGDNGNGA